MEKHIIDWFLSVIEKLPDVDSFSVPSEIYNGIDNITNLLGYFMPYNLYEPLLLFILSFTAFRIAYAIYMRRKK